MKMSIDVHRKVGKIVNKKIQEMQERMLILADVALFDYDDAKESEKATIYYKAYSLMCDALVDMALANDFDLTNDDE